MSEIKEEAPKEEPPTMEVQKDKKDAKDKKPKRNFLKKFFTRRNLIIGCVSLFLICLVTLASVLGYLYYKSRDDIKELKDDKATLEDEKESLENEKASLEADLQAAQEAGATTDAEKQALQDTIDGLEAKSAKIALYNDVFEYAVDLLLAHPTLTGFTEAEYQTGRALAVKTGDQSLVNAADNAWHNTDGNPVTRYAQVFQEISDGIEANI